MKCKSVQERLTFVPILQIDTQHAWRIYSSPKPNNFLKMQAIVSKVKSLLTYKKKIRIDNAVFNLHKVTSGILFVLSLIISTALYVKQPMTCICINDKNIEKVIDTYCWIHSTYTLPEKLNSENSSEVVAHPGVGQYNKATDDIKIHKYYQWVCFVLFFQAISFYTPRWIWKSWEGGRIKALSENLDDLMPKENQEDTKNKRKLHCLEYFHRSMGANDNWSMSYGICEVLNFVNVVIQIYLTDWFVGRALSTYGLSLIQFERRDPMHRTDPLAIVFPTVTKCTFNMIGPSGNIIPYDALCVLPFNIYNEKFYPLLWFWFILLAVFSGLALVYRLCTFLFPELRYKLLRRKFRVADKDLDRLWELNRKLDYGDWYLLYQIGKNMGTSTFLDFLNSLSNMTSGESDPRKEKYL